MPRFFLFIPLFIVLAFNPIVILAVDTGKDPSSSALLEIEVTGNRISLNVQNAEIVSVLNAIARKAKIDLSIGETVCGRVNLKMSNATIEEILKKLSENTVFVFEYLPDKKAYRVVKTGTYASEEPDGAALKVETTTSKSRPKQVDPITSGTAKRKTLADSSLPPVNSEKKQDVQGRPLYKSGELLIKFKPEATDKQILKLHQSIGSKVLKRIEQIRLEKIKLPEGLSDTAAISLYRSADIVASAELHALRYPNVTPDDPLFSEQWSLAGISAPAAWDFTQGSHNVVIAVIDTGIDYLHSDLADNIWINTLEFSGTPDFDDDGNGYIDDVYGWDFADNDADPMDVDGHGTHVTGIIAAKGNNGLGITGVAWNAGIMALKVQSDGSDSIGTFDVIEALAYAKNKGAGIVNCSFGGSTFVQTEYDALSGLESAGVLAVCAAGNDGVDTDPGGSPNYPSAYDLPNIISVAASNQDDSLASFSNFGAASVDLMAPGTSIKSTIPGGRYTAASVIWSTTEYQAIGMAFAGKTDDNGIVGLLLDCGKGYPDEFSGGVNGNIALIERGSRNGEDFYFYEKATNAQNADAVAIIIYNNVVDDFDDNGGTLIRMDNWVPVVSITKADGEALKALETPTVTLVNRPIALPSSFSLKSGTSMAAPHVAGVAGLLLALDSNLNYEGIKLALTDTVDKISSVTNKMVSGGRLNVQNALCSISPVPGDLTCNNNVALDDAILGLQVLAGFNPYICATCIPDGIDVNGDNKVGLEEVIYILQRVSGLRLQSK